MIQTNPITKDDYMLSRAAIADRILNCKKELAIYEAIQTNCTRCAFLNQSGVCQKFGQPVPEDFQQVGCDEFRFDDIPF